MKIILSFLRAEKNRKYRNLLTIQLKFSKINLMHLKTMFPQGAVQKLRNALVGREDMVKCYECDSVCGGGGGGGVQP